MRWVELKSVALLSLLICVSWMWGCGDAGQSSGSAVTPQSEQARLKTLVDQFQDTFCECYDPQNAFCDPAQRIQGPNYIAAGSCGAEVARCYPNDALDLYACINDRYERMDECAKACPADPAVCVPILTEQLPAECAPQIERFSELNTQCANGNMQCPVQQTPPPTTGGPNPNTPDPVFNSWKDSMREVAEYDCSCSQQGNWGPVWDENTCRNMWNGHIGRAVTESCQYDALVKDETYRARFYEYANCHVSNNDSFLSCIGRGQCRSDGFLSCILSWNDGRVACDKRYPEIDVVVSNSCREEEDFPLISALSLADNFLMASGGSVRIGKPTGFDLAERHEDCDLSSCVFMNVKFESNGVYKFYTQYISSGGYGQGGYGVYGLDDFGRIYFSEDCTSSANMNVMFAFQRAWFNGTNIRRGADTLETPYIANVVYRDLSRADVCD